MKSRLVILESVGYIIWQLLKITAAQNEVALSYLRVRGLYYLAVIKNNCCAE